MGVFLRIRIVAIGAVLGALWPMAASAEPPFSPKLGAAGWQAIFLPGVSKTRFDLHPDGTLTISANRSFGLIYRMVMVSETKRRYLEWRWRLETGPAGIDLTRKGKDDRPIAIHVWFPAQPGEQATSSWLSRLRDRMSGLPSKGWSLSYVWGGASTAGTVLDNPYHKGRGKLVVLRPTDAMRGRWYRERVDLARDFRRAFGFLAPAVAYIAVSADTDDRGGYSRSRVASIRMTGPDRLPAAPKKAPSNDKPKGNAEPAPPSGTDR